MAKYKHPKNEKHKARKDLKDYTIDKEVEGMVPNASGEPMPEVPRKDDKEVIDDVDNMVPKVKDSDKIYVTKELQDGDPKMPSNALKTLVKNQEDDAKELIDTLSKKDGGYMTQIEKLTKEQKEKLVKEIVRRKVVKFLSEQEDNEPDNVEQPTEEPAEEPLADTPEPPAAPEAPAEPADAPAPEPPAEEPVEEPVEEPAEEPATEPAAEPELDADGKDPRVTNFMKALDQKDGVLQQVKLLMSVVNDLANSKEGRQKLGLLALLKRVIDKSVQQAQSQE
jgi:hypothetical protein